MIKIKFPYTVNFKYKLSDSFIANWSRLGVKPIRFSLSFIVNLLFLIIIINLVIDDGVISFYLLPFIIILYFLLKGIMSLVIVPVYSFLKIGHNREINIMYSDVGVKVVIDNREVFNHWNIYDDVKIYKHSFQLVRKDSLPTIALPIRIFNNYNNFSEFISLVKHHIDEAKEASTTY